MLILGLLGVYFDAAVVFFTKSLFMSVSCDNLKSDRLEIIFFSHSENLIRQRLTFCLIFVGSSPSRGDIFF